MKPLPEVLGATQAYPTRSGARGPHFFRGVSTVVSKLLNIVQPDRVYMGQKDAMQCFLVRKLVDELNFPTAVVVVPTVRESDGLAMSSRNAVSLGIVANQWDQFCNWLVVSLHSICATSNGK
eukprot:SAG31_NODE_10761_length_1101_cov_0.872255_1_plen_122_part_00